MKTQLTEHITNALTELHDNGDFASDVTTQCNVQLTRTRDSQFGDWTSNIALLAAKILKQPPRTIATKIIAQLPVIANVAKVDIAGPGFINFYLADNANLQIITEILERKHTYGHSDYGKQQRIHIEYVSANPTGPLHVGHGRGAAYGATLANILTAADFQVHREYYVNDAGRQMSILAVSVWCRYLQLCNEAMPFPSAGYQGDYIHTIAKLLFNDIGTVLQRSATEITATLPADTEKTNDQYIDALIAYAKNSLSDAYWQLQTIAADTLRQDIHDDLAEFGVTFDQWFSERSLTDSGDIQTGIQQLTDGGHTYQRDGALWFKSTAFGDDKDRVLVRENGQTTYFASDVAYQMNKYNRGFTKVINIFGADHHGYVARLRAFLTAMGKQVDDSFIVSFVQFAILWRDKQKVSMSTRSGEYVTLRQLRQEVGNDAARFFYVMRKHEQHMDFDLTLAISKTNDNPVYYIQYAHARICSIWRQLTEKGIRHDMRNGLANLAALSDPTEKALLPLLARYPEMIVHGASTLEAHGIAHYLRELAASFHAYYNAQQFIVDDNAVRDARLCLVNAVQIVLQNGLSLIGVSAPEKM